MHARLRRPAVALLATTLTAGALGFMPAAQAADGTLAGTVTAPGGLLLDDVRVELYQRDVEDGRWRETGDFTDTVDGTYSFSVPEGQYAVGFDDYTDVYAAEFYNNADIVEDAAPVSVPGTTLATELAPAAHVTGTVLDEVGDPLGEVTVVAYRPVVVDGYTEYRQVGFDQTASVVNPGTYNIGGLPGGDYIIEFEAYAAQGMHDYAIEYYDDKPNRYVADPVTVADGITEPGIDAQLELDSQISGVVDDTVDGTPADNGTVVVYTKVGGDYLEIEEVDIASDGTYVVDGLAADTYYLRFRADVAGGQAQEYWDDQSSVLTATGIELGLGETEGAISPVLVLGQNQTPSLQPVTAPAIAGTLQVGSPLTASPGTWSPAPTSVRYSWFADGVVRQDSSSAVYVPVAADLGKQIAVDVYVTATGYGTSRGSAVASGLVVPAPVPPAPPVVTPPVVTPPVVTPPVVTPPAPVVDVPTALAKALAEVKVTGKPKVGRTLKVSNVDLDLRTAVTYRFQWYAGAKKIKKATKSKLKVLKAMKGKKVSVKVTGTAGSTTKSIKIKVGKVR